MIIRPSILVTAFSRPFQSLKAVNPRTCTYTPALKIKLSKDLFLRRSFPSCKSLQHHQHLSKVLFSSKLHVPEQTKSEITLETLPEELRTSFLQGETDGIMKIGPSLISSFTGEEIIIAALEATRNSKGQAAAIINAMIGSCDQEGINGNDYAPALAWDIYTTWEELAEELELYPDIVTFCCTYSAVLRSTSTEDEYFQDCANEVLERAQRHSKKIAGSKRRKLLNSISRRSQGSKNGNNNNVRAIDQLKEMQESSGHDVDVLYENDDVIVINKPSGMVCFHSKKTTDGKIGRKKKGRISNKKKKNTKLEAGTKGFSENQEIADNYSDISLEDTLIDIGVSLSKLNPDALGIVHRIDRGTSGCIILAKNDDAHARLVTAFFTRSAKKRYSALIPYEATSTVNSQKQPLEPSGTIETEVGGRPSKSSYTVHKAFGELALQLDVETHSGRKHQVRIHCSKGLERPIFLDPLYSEMSKSENRNNDAIDIIGAVAQPGGRRFFLHASTLCIEEFGIDVNARLPDWWSPVLKSLEKSAKEMQR